MLERVGYAIEEAPSVGEIRGGRPPVAVVVTAQRGRDPFRHVRAVRARTRFAHSLVFAWAPEGIDPPVGAAVASGAEDLIAQTSSDEESVDRIVARLHRSRTLHERTALDSTTHIRGRSFVAEWMSAEIGHAVNEHPTATFGVVWLSRFAIARAERGLLAAERDIEAAAFALSLAVRPCDLPCRLSDDTFVVLFPGAAIREAADLLERARLRMTTRAAPLGLRIALAAAPDEGNTWQQLFTRAEARLRTARPQAEEVPRPPTSGDDDT